MDGGVYSATCRTCALLTQLTPLLEAILQQFRSDTPIIWLGRAVCGGLSYCEARSVEFEEV